MNILGLNAYHGDASACLVIDGRLVAAAEEERFRRVKHWAGFPSQAIQYCLNEAGLSMSDIDHIAVNRDPEAHFFRKLFFAISNRPSPRAIVDRLKNARRIRDIRGAFTVALRLQNPGNLRASIHSVEHHRAHLGSAFYVSGFDSSTVVSVDGFGDFASVMWGTGEGSKMRVYDQVYFPHSLGLFYLAMTQFLGFPHYGDEYKVMGLASYGKPIFLDKMRRILKVKSDGKFELDLSYFLHHADGVSMTWSDGEPHIGSVASEKLEKLLGPARKSDQPIGDFHRNVAASAQAAYEEVFFHLLKSIFRKTGNKNLCLAGGCAMNSVANGKVYRETPFSNIYIQAAAGDAGGAIGAAFYVWHQILGKPRSFVMDQAYWGPRFEEAQILRDFQTVNGLLSGQSYTTEKIEDTPSLLFKTAKAIGEGRVVGWFQGRMELGSRALGNRSILCDPRRSDMKEILNSRIKRRESFRPFAPSILREKVSEWFETDADVPFMSQVFQVRPERRAAVPAVTHVDGSGRLQTVARHQNPRYYDLIQTFGELTGVPILLNTSFNENEPIVCTPREALDCFLRTKMDVLVLENYFLKKSSDV